MKKLLLSSIVLLTFAASLTLFQMSCKKEATAETIPTSTTTTQVGKIIYGKLYDVDQNASFYQVWTANYDGSGQQQIKISLPANFYIVEGPKTSPDGKLIFFETEHYVNGSTAAGEFRIYSCNTDGTNVKQIVGDSQYLSLGSVY